jgi:hypothetical protein
MQLQQLPHDALQNDLQLLVIDCTAPQRILAVGSCHIDPSIKVLPGPEAYDTATIIVEVCTNIHICGDEHMY